jgi:site-specific recombinase XerD
MKQTQWIKAYIDYLKQICGFAQRTIKFHQRMCRLWDDFMQNQRHRPLAYAVADDFVCWIFFRQQQGIGNGTIRKELCALRTLYKYLFDYAMITKNPAASLPELICRPAPEQQYLTVDECFKFINAFNTGTDDGFRNYTIAVILWCTGLRSAELCALRWADIDLDQGTLLVRKGKGGKQRLLFLNDRLWEDMRGYHEKMGGGADEPVFYALTNNQHTANSPSRALSQSALVDMIRHHANGVGIGKKVSPRMFRHTFATQMLEAGVSIDDIKEMLGHDDETETCIYIHVTIEAVKQLLENHIGNPKG